MLFIWALRDPKTKWVSEWSRPQTEKECCEQLTLVIHEYEESNATISAFWIFVLNGPHSHKHTRLFQQFMQVVRAPSSEASFNRFYLALRIYFVRTTVWGTEYDCQVTTERKSPLPLQVNPAVTKQPSQAPLSHIILAMTPATGILPECYKWVLTVTKNLNSVIWVRERTIPTERPPLVGEVTANFCG
jgi:hypothetical protein